MVYRKDFDHLLEVQFARGSVLPALGNRPIVPAHLDYIWEGFWCLMSSRNIGFGMGPIPLTEIKAYIELFAIKDVSLFVTCIRAMDSQYLRQKSEEADRKNGGK